MRIEYLRANDSSEHFNVDVYEPVLPSPADGRANNNSIPVIIIASGGGGKDLLTGDDKRGKHAAGYHDLGEHLSCQGFFVVVPSRRGDPQRVPKLRSQLRDVFADRLPTELFEDCGPNEGCYTHMRQVTELESVIDNLSQLCGPTAAVKQVGLLGKSAGCGVALCLGAKRPDRIATIALWCCSLTTSQWFLGPKADDIFKRVLTDRQVQYDRNAFIRELCDAMTFVGDIAAPILFACTAADSYAEVPTERDPWATPEEQVQLLHYAVKTRRAKATIIKGAEHTMYRELPTWTGYTSTLGHWLKETF